MKDDSKPLKILTGNRLGDGTAIWYAGAGRWVERLDGALAVQAGDAEAVAELERAAREALAANHAVDLNLIDARPGPDGAQPVRLRERIRAEGPTIVPRTGRAGPAGAGPENGKADHVSL